MTPAGALAYPGYVDPLAGASVTPERIDQGVDYAGSGTLEALGPGVVTEVEGQGSSGWPGSFVEYQLTGGPLAGQRVYYAEGVNPSVKVGQTLTAGEAVATLIPGWSTGIEVGFGSGAGSSTYAQQHGGYTEGQQTAAGLAFSDLVSALGGPAGVQDPNAQVVGEAPQGAAAAAATSSPSSSSGSGGILGSGIGPNVGPDSNPVDAVKSLFSGFLSWVESNLLRGALYAVLIIGGLVLAVRGLSRTFSTRTEGGAQ